MKRCIPKQSSLLHSYFKVSYWLLIALLLFIAESLYYQTQLENTYETEYFNRLFWFCCFLFSFSHIFLVLMDSWSRFQNYKRIKDQLFVYGFQPKIVNNYMVSKCQRQALKIACQELNLHQEYERYLQLCQVKWYHFIPYFMIQDPLFLFKRHFWNRTFLEKIYHPKFDYRQLYLEEKNLYKNRGLL